MSAFNTLVGETPLVPLKILSESLGIELFGKAEYLNPGGSTKDRVARSVVQIAEIQGLLRPGGEIHEASSGSTGISLAMSGAASGYKVIIYVPDDISPEKVSILRHVGAEVVLCPTVSMSDARHFCKIAKDSVEAAVKQGRNAFYADQFDNLGNFASHYLETGEEIWRQCEGKVDVFVASSGTGGTIAGVGRKLKERNSSVKIVLGDPQGSALYGKVKHGVLFTPEDREGRRRRLIRDTIVEGVGINRLSRNFEMGCHFIDDALRIDDRAVVEMSRWLVKSEGLFLGSSSALNCAAVVKAVNCGMIKRGSRVVTLLCDSGSRHLSKLYNEPYLRSVSLLPLSVHKLPSNNVEENCGEHSDKLEVII